MTGSKKKWLGLAKKLLGLAALSAGVAAIARVVVGEGTNRGAATDNRRGPSPKDPSPEGP